jgi:hypothetical protein
VWQPNMRHVFCGQDLGGHKRIAMLELNGLGHGGFTCSEDAALTVRQLAWSPDSELLAVLLCDQVRVASRCSNAAICMYKLGQD